MTNIIQQQMRLKEILQQMNNLLFENWTDSVAQKYQSQYIEPLMKELDSFLSMTQEEVLSLQKQIKTLNERSNTLTNQIQKFIDSPLTSFHGKYIGYAYSEGRQRDFLLSFSSIALYDDEETAYNKIAEEKVLEFEKIEEAGFTGKIME